MIEVNGSIEHGMTLADVRRFVEETKDMPADVWVDCRVPSDSPDHESQLAALMGLQA